MDKRKQIDHCLTKGINMVPFSIPTFNQTKRAHPDPEVAHFCHIVIIIILVHQNMQLHDLFELVSQTKFKL